MRVVWQLTRLAFGINGTEFMKRQTQQINDFNILRIRITHTHTFADGRMRIDGRQNGTTTPSDEHSEFVHIVYGLCLISSLSSVCLCFPLLIYMIRTVSHFAEMIRVHTMAHVAEEKQKLKWQSGSERYVCVSCECVAFRLLCAFRAQPNNIWNKKPPTSHPERLPAWESFPFPSPHTQIYTISRRFVWETQMQWHLIDVCERCKPFPSFAFVSIFFGISNRSKCICHCDRHTWVTEEHK